MKYLIIFALIVAAGCDGSGKQGSGSTDNNDNIATSNNDTTGGKNLNDTIRVSVTGNTDAGVSHSGTGTLFAGAFATWHFPGGDEFDGLYDSTLSLFRLCGSDSLKHAPVNEISYNQDATCDTVRNKRVMLIERDSTGRLKPVGVNLNVVGDHAYTIGEKTQRVIKLSPSAVERIKAAKELKFKNLRPAVKDTSSGSLQSSPDNQKSIDQLKSTQLEQPAVKAIEKENAKTGKQINNAMHKVAVTKVQK